MRLRCLSTRRLLFSATFFMLAQPALAQVQSPTPAPGDDVVRVNADLVQTDVMVFDKQGNFVDGLKPDQFVLKIDGKQREISFFDRILAGSRNVEAQLAAARGNARVPSRPGSRAVPLDRGRTVFFFIDDLHLSPSSINSTRKLLLRYTDREMRQNDDVAIVSASGQIGFLQQLTDDKAVLHAAVQRLTSRPYDVRDMEYPRMSESQALAIERNDDDVLTYFVDALVKQDPQLPRGNAPDHTRDRAQQILQEAASITTHTLASIRTV